MCCFQARDHDLRNSISKTSTISAQFILNNESQCQSFLATTLMMFIVLSTHSLLRAIYAAHPLIIPTLQIGELVQKLCFEGRGRLS